MTGSNFSFGEHYYDHLRCRLGWHRWIVLPLVGPELWLERVCLRCGKHQRLVADRWGLSLEWHEAPEASRSP